MMERMSPIGWALRPLKNYARFSGRASRAEFWWFFLFTMLIYLVVIFALGMGGGALGAMNPGGALARGSFGIGMIFVLLYWLALFVPMLAVQFRRLHDTNRSGWWLGAFWLLYLVYMVTTFGIFASRIGAPGSPPPGASFAIVGIAALLFFAYSIALLVFFCLPGTRGPNRFGDDPYGQDVGEVFA